MAAARAADADTRGAYERGPAHHRNGAANPPSRPSPNTAPTCAAGGRPSFAWQSCWWRSVKQRGFPTDCTWKLVTASCAESSARGRRCVTFRNDCWFIAQAGVTSWGGRCCWHRLGARIHVRAPSRSSNRVPTLFAAPPAASPQHRRPVAAAGSGTCQRGIRRVRALGSTSDSTACLAFCDPARGRHLHAARASPATANRLAAGGVWQCFQGRGWWPWLSDGSRAPWPCPRRVVAV